MNELGGSFKQLICDLSLFSRQACCLDKDVNKVLGFFSSGTIFFDQFTGYNKRFSADVIKAFYWSKTSLLVLRLYNLTELETGELVNQKAFCYRINVSPQLMKAVGTMYEELGRVHISGMVAGSGISNSFVLCPDRPELLETADGAGRDVMCDDLEYEQAIEFETCEVEGNA
ncbi:MAG: hypothetical protein WC608_05560 [Parcubacteria group bacterium]